MEAKIVSRQLIVVRGSSDALMDVLNGLQTQKKMLWRWMVNTVSHDAGEYILGLMLQRNYTVLWTQMVLPFAVMYECMRHDAKRLKASTRDFPLVKAYHAYYLLKH